VKESTKEPLEVVPDKIVITKEYWRTKRNPTQRIFECIFFHGTDKWQDEVVAEDISPNPSREIQKLRAGKGLADQNPDYAPAIEVWRQSGHAYVKNPKKKKTN
jgi:hypothetical protein